MAGTRSELTFRPRARIIRTIGDQLISGPEAAVIELVKNSYDADASFVSIRFEPPLKSGFGAIIVRDDGHGMSAADITDKWMEPATSSKVANRKSDRGRTMLGSKGIGRFAAAKLGRRLTLTSVFGNKRPRQKSTIHDLDWSVFEGDRYLSEVVINFSEEPTQESTGTTIEMHELREAWSKDKMEELIGELRRLISPIDKTADDQPFNIFLDLADCTGPNCGFDGPALLSGGRGGNESDPRGAELVPFPLLASSDYVVDGYFDDKGTFHGSMEIKRGGQAPTPIELAVPLAEGEPSCGRVEVHLSIFDREGDAVKETVRRAGMGELTVAKARQALDETAGVSIYRDAFRVRPYGSLESDWLALDSRRVQDPSLRIGHNQVAGYITVESQSGSALVEKSSREGFEENAAFRRLRKLITELFTKVVEPRRQLFREGARIGRRRKTAFEDIDNLAQLRKTRSALASLPPEKRESAERVLAEETSQLQDEILQLKERQRVLEAQSSLGLIVGEIIHEGAPDASFISTSSSRLLTAWRFVFTNGPKSDEAKKLFPERLELMGQSGERLRALFATLRPLAGGRNDEPSSFNVMNVLSDTAGIFAETHNVEFDLREPPDAVYLFGHPEDLGTALLNLFSNSVYWLEEARTADPRVTLSLADFGGEIAIYIEDNGPGIPEEFAERIFDIRFTLKNGGTGLGLNIAQEALVRSGGRLLFHPEFETGAKFEIRFPKYKGGDA